MCLRQHGFVASAVHCMTKSGCTSQVNSGPLQAYYKAAYAQVRRYSSSCFVAIAPRVFEQDGREWQYFMTGSGYTNVLQDLHKCANTECRRPG